MNNPARLVLVDDDPNFLLIFSEILRQEGHEVFGAESGRQALKVVRDQRPDLVLMDVGLPDINGIEVCRQIKADPSLAGTLVMLISGAATSLSEKVQGLDIGADDYLLKTTEVNEIRARIRTMIRLRETTIALRASEQHYRQLVELLPEGVSIIDLEGRLLAVNPQAAAMLGYESPVELLKKSAFDLTPPEEHERVAANIATVLEKGLLRDAESVVLRKNGEHFPIELSIAPLRDGQGRMHAMVCVWRDVTSRKRAEEELRASEVRFRQLAEHIREVFWMTDVTKSQMIYISPAYEEIWGRSCASLYAAPKEWVESLHPEDLNQVLEAASTKQVEGRYNETYRIVRPDGSIRWIQDRAFPIRDESGKVYRIAGIGEDITQRRQVEESLRESEARKGAIMQAAMDGIITFAHTGLIAEVNFAAEKMFGYTGKAIAGRVLAELLLPPSLQPWFELGLAKFFSTDEGPILGSRTEITALRAHRVEFPVELCITRVELAGPPLFTAFFRDISGRRRTENKLATLAHALETTTEPVYITDLKDRITFVNRAFLKTYGYVEDEIMAKSGLILLSTGNPAALLAEIQAQAHLGNWQGEVLHRRKDATELPVFLSTSQIKDRTGDVIGLMHVTRDISERKRTEAALGQLPRRIIEAQEAERQRVARDLHDGVNQVIASVKMRLRNVGESLAAANPAAHEILSRCERLLVQAIEENRRIAHNLRPSDLDELGLAAACRNFCAALRARSGMRVIHHVSRELPRLSPGAELNLFRILQEAVSNAEKHSKAKTLRVRLVLQHGVIRLWIQDDGIGFTGAKARRPRRESGGIGLTNMHQRAASLGGMFSIASVPRKGTTVTVGVPVKPSH